MFKRVLNVAAEVGWYNALLLAINRLLTNCHLPVRFIRYYLVAQPVASKAFLPPGRGSDLYIRVMQEGDPGFRALPLRSEVLRYRYSQNSVCLGMFRGDDVVGCAWFSFETYMEDEVRCRYVLQPTTKCVWDYDVYIAPSARGGVAFLRLWDGANVFLSERGVHWSLSRISAFNSRSFGSHARLGARHVGSVLFLKLGASQVMFLSHLPFVHISISGKSVPSVVVQAPNSHE